MIVTPDTKPHVLKAGRIAGEALQYGKKLIKIGESLLEVSDKIEEKIRQMLKGEEESGLAFPAQISFNETAAHNCPTDEDKTVFKEGMVVKVDCGVHIKGCMADNALTVDLSDDGGYKNLLEASKQARDKAIPLMKPGASVSEIGAVIAEIIEKFGFKPVKNLSGHGLDIYTVHTSPSIPNFNTGAQTKLQEGHLVAVEPFASMGAGMIEELGEAEIFMLVAKKPVRNQFTRDVLKHLEIYKGLPFTTRWLTKKFSLPKITFALTELQRIDSVKAYPPLVDKNRGFISQHEHTVIIGDKPIATTKVE